MLWCSDVLYSRMRERVGTVRSCWHFHCVCCLLSLCFLSAEEHIDGTRPIQQHDLTAVTSLVLSHKVTRYFTHPHPPRTLFIQTLIIINGLFTLSFSPFPSSLFAFCGLISALAQQQSHHHCEWRNRKFVPTWKSGHVTQLFVDIS